MNVSNSRVVVSRLSCTYVGYSNLSELGRNHSILGDLRSKNEKENLLGCSGQRLAHRASSAPRIVFFSKGAGALRDSMR